MPIHAHWLVGLYDRLQNKSDVISGAEHETVTKK